MHPRSLAVCALAAAVAGATAAPALATAPGRNGQLGWQQEPRDAPPHLWVANPDGSQARAVFAEDQAATYEGTFSPTAPTTMAFSRGVDKPFSDEIYLGDLATGQTRPLTSSKNAAVAPAFSPDGARIAFFSVRPPTRRHGPGPERIAVVNVDGTGLKLLTPQNRSSIDPDFSPDGKQIVYDEARRAGPASSDNRLMVMNADGTHRRALTAYGGRREINPKWLPDGTGVVFESLNRRSLKSDIERIAADGTGRRAVLATSAFETNPVPSPDGTRIAFTSDRDRRGPTRLGPGFEVYTATLDGGNIVRVTSNQVPDLFPDWQRLPAAARGAAAAAVKRVNVDKAGAKKLRINGDWLAAGRGGIWLSGQHEIYRLDPRTGRRVATIAVPEGPCQATDVGAGALWTATCDQPGLTRIDTTNNRVARHVALPVSTDYGGEGSIGAGAGAIWVVTDAPECTACRVSRVDPATMTVTREIPVMIGAATVRVGAGSVWVANPVEDVVQQIDPATGAVTRTAKTGPGPRFMDVGAGAAWTLDQVDGTVTRIDAATGATSRIKTGVVGEGGDLTFGGGSVWARGTSPLLVRIDARRRRVVARYGPPSDRGAVIVGGGAVWISAHDIDTVWRLPLRDA